MSKVSNLSALLADAIASLPEQEKVSALNDARRALHAVSPFRNEPIDLVEWVPCESVRANSYNPNTVAPPEMRLLSHSVSVDGYTQPVVTHLSGDGREVVDGFHRKRVCSESVEVRQRTRGYLPVTTLASDRADEDRMAATIRHNRARGTHGMDPMTVIVGYMGKKGWDDAKIGKELGMDMDEVLRFRQVSGLAELFRDREFSEAWEVSLK